MKKRPHVSRRSIVVGAAALGLVLGPTAGAAAAAEGPPTVTLWESGAPGSEAKRATPETSVGTNLAGIHNPSLVVFLPEKGQGTGDAVVVLPGGGHRVLVVEKEGFTVA